MADAFSYFGESETTETEVFVRNFDRFFDCLNVRSKSEGTKKRKPDLRPYTSPEDERLKVIILFFTSTFYTYFATYVHIVVEERLLRILEQMASICTAHVSP